MASLIEKSFAGVAEEFCAWCEGSPLGEDAAATAAMWLSKLYAAALALPETEPDDEDGLPDLPEDAIAKARSNLARFNGMYYREFFDPDPALDEEPVMGDVGDDLLDTYKDIKAGSLLFQQGAVAEALWHWSFMHRVHWGRHAVGALYALHCLSVASRA